MPRRCRRSPIRGRGRSTCSASRSARRCRREGARRPVPRAHAPRPPRPRGQRRRRVEGGARPRRGPQDPLRGGVPMGRSIWSPTVSISRRRVTRSTLSEPPRQRGRLLSPTSRERAQTGSPARRRCRRVRLGPAKRAVGDVVPRTKGPRPGTTSTHPLPEPADVSSRRPDPSKRPTETAYADQPGRL